MQNFKNRVAVITGGASGIGLALARRLGAEGDPLSGSSPRELCEDSPTRRSCDGLRVLRHRLVECSNQRMGTVGPGSGTVFRLQLRLSSGHVTRLNERPFDLCQGVVFIRRIEIIDEVPTGFRDRCVVGGYAELPVRQAFRNRQSPTLAETWKDRE